MHRTVLRAKELHETKKEKQTKGKERRKMRKESMFCHLFDMYSYSYSSVVQLLKRFLFNNLIF